MIDNFERWDANEQNMTSVDQIIEVINALPEEEYVLLRQWFSERDLDKWDQQIVNDSASGNLDFPIKEALAAKTKGIKEL